MSKIISKIKRVFADLHKQTHMLAFFSSLALLLIIMFCLVPTLPKTLLVVISFLSMTSIFLSVYRKAKEWKVTENVIKISSYVIYELALLGTFGSFWLIGQYNYSLVATGIAFAYLGLGLLYATMLFMYTEKKDPSIMAAEEARRAQEQKRREEFARLILVTNEGLNLIRATAERMPQVNERFFELSYRMEIIEKAFTDMVSKHKDDEQRQLDALVSHSNTCIAALEKLKTDAYQTITSERERFKKETEIIVDAMSESLDGIITTIEDSFAPFKDSIEQLGGLDETTSSAIDRLSEAAETFVKISEPQAKLAGEAADLINESLVNIRNIASQSLNIVSIELKEQIDDAVVELKASSR